MVGEGGLHCRRWPPLHAMSLEPAHGSWYMALKQGALALSPSTQRPECITRYLVLELEACLGCAWKHVRARVRPALWAVPLPAPNKNKRIMAMAPRSVDDGTGTKLPVGKILEELSIMFTYVSEFLRKVMRRALHASRSTCSTRIAPMHTADAGVALAQANARPHLCRWRACCCWPKGGGLKCRARMSHIQSAAPLLCRRPCLAASCPLLAAGP